MGLPTDSVGALLTIQTTALKRGLMLLSTDHPSAIMMPWFQNGTCDPYGPQSEPCALGNLVSYSVHLSSASDVIAAYDFARERNIRLAIKNTGHEYANAMPYFQRLILTAISSFLGKNTGRGALGLWTHKLDSIEIVTEFASPSYTGPAIKLGAGVQAHAAYQAAHAAGYRVVGGTCPTVGLAGGYTQGGGHSVLTSLYGMAADNVLGWEVVTPSGEIILTSPNSHADLHWALSGGGGGTFGVVLSMTAKLHPEGPVGGAIFMFSPPSEMDKYYDAIEAFQSSLSRLVDAGAAAWYVIKNAAFTAFITAPTLTSQDITSLLAPATDALVRHGMAYTLSLSEDASYFEHFVRYYGPLPAGIWETSHILGSRLLPRNVIDSKNAAVVGTYKDILTDSAWSIAGLAINASHAVSGTSPGINAVHPAWRETLVHVFAYSEWDWSAPDPVCVMQEREAFLTDSIEPSLRALAPDSGSYLNEANFAQVDWQEAFYGGNYERLLEVKHKYDPEMLLYAPTAVGSEAWVVDGEGRLCHV